MNKTNDYCAEKYRVNTTNPDESGTRIHIYSYCDSRWLSNRRIKILRNDLPYSVYSLNLNGLLESTDQDSGNVLRYEAGSFTISKPVAGRFILRSGNDGPVIRKFILARRNALHDIIADRMLGSINCLKLKDINAVELIMNNLRSALSKKEKTDNAYLNGLFFQLLNELHTQIQKINYPESLRKALDYINYTFDKSYVNRSLIAEVVGVSVRTLSNLFTEHLGTSFFAYVINLRLAQVCRMLEFSDMPIGEIAGKCGFTTPNFMSREFREKYGIPPRDYRITRQSKH
jgi:AraC-like DNA-binding protein